MSTYVKGTRVRVNRKVGAFAVYNRPRVVAIVVAVVAILAGAGYVAGRLTAPDTTTKAAAPPRVAATPAATPTPVVRVDKAAVAAADRRGFARGLAKGRVLGSRATGKAVSGAPAGATALGALSALPAGTPFIVTRRAHGLGFKLPVVSGFVYRMCPDGRGICRRPDGT